MQSAFSFVHKILLKNKRPFDHFPVMGKKIKKPPNLGHFLWVTTHNKMMQLMLCAETFDFLAQRTRSPVTEWC